MHFFGRPNASQAEFEQLYAEVVQAAEHQLSQSARATDAEVEYFQLLTVRRASQPLGGFVSSVQRLSRFCAQRKWLNCEQEQDIL